MSNNRIAIFSWSIPKGGLAKVILKEYYDFKNKKVPSVILTQGAIPDAYFKEFENIDPGNCVIVKPHSEGRIKDISDFLPGVKVSMNGSFLSNVISLTLYLRKNEFSTIISHQLLSAFILWPYYIMSRKPYILVLHDNPFLFLKKDNIKSMSFFRRFKASVIYLLSNIVIFSSKHTVCTTPQIKEEVEKNLKVHKELLVAEYGIDTFQAVNHGGRKIIMTVSKWSQFRNPAAYLEVLDLLPKTLSLVMVGRWDTQMEIEKFKAEVFKRGLEDRLIIRDNVLEEELSSLYNQTRVFVRLGFSESGTGQAILEAIGHGCPVVISKGLGASTMVKDGGNGFVVDENNLEEVSNKIFTIFGNDQMVERMSNFSYKVAKEHSWQTYLDKISSLTE